MVEPQDILRYLQYHACGQKKAVGAKEIAAHFGIGGRQVREMIHELRRQCKPVCSDHSGYWWPQSRRDAAAGAAYITALFGPLREANDGFFAGLDKLFEPNLFDQRDEDVAV